MSYYLDDAELRLRALRKRLESTDLIPSHAVLLEGIGPKFSALEKAGCKTVRELRSSLKNAKTLAKLAAESGVEAEYLGLLRRAVEGFFPKPQPMAAFDWVPRFVLQRLSRAGIESTLQLHHAAKTDPHALANGTGLTPKELAEPVALADLSRVQWTSPTFARVLVAAGYDSAAKVADADPEELCSAVAAANEGGRYYNGKLGLRDIKRLVVAAGYAPRP
jgi:hypothetical protein